MNKKLIILLFALIIFLILFSIFNNQNNISKDEIIIDGHKIMVEIADDAIEQYNGLSNREAICQNCGMLFVFSDNSIKTFIMRNMKFGLDIVWIKDNKIIQIDQNLKPEGNVPKYHYSSNLPVNYVLELNAGYVEKNNIKIGDYVKINL